ncbi:MAG: carboxylesterase family protein [Acidimicrobiales bacterium]
MIIDTTAGPVRGTVERTVDGADVYRFAGIPYAQPPVGPLRFRAPQPVTPWTDVRDATMFGPIAPKLVFARRNVPRPT